LAANQLNFVAPPNRAYIDIPSYFESGAAGYHGNLKRRASAAVLADERSTRRMHIGRPSKRMWISPDLILETTRNMRQIIRKSHKTFSELVSVVARLEATANKKEALKSGQGPFVDAVVVLHVVQDLEAELTCIEGSEEILRLVKLEVAAIRDALLDAHIE
jgi:hypothetical protein